ncbi:TPR repeat [Candidatus Burkholderia humilis]|nr:TPR repeat [Candidatus Burkholderia humilis]
MPNVKQNGPEIRICGPFSLRIPKAARYCLIHVCERPSSDTPIYPRARQLLPAVLQLHLALVELAVFGIENLAAVPRIAVLPHAGDDRHAFDELMDFVIAVDTSIIHLAGALGKPAWLILPLYGDWRWHYARSDSPWYPSVWLVRREYGCGWTEVVERLRAELAQAVTSRQ